MNTKTKKYRLMISDGMSSNAGGELVIECQSLGEAKDVWEDWAKNGEYPIDGTVKVSGSIVDLASNTSIEVSTTVIGSGR